MADQVTPEIVIVRRRLGFEAEMGKGGVWKIAFADFMTAMMAFFLVLWLISANEKTKVSIARYFNPINLVDATVRPKGLNDPKQASEGKSDQKAKAPESGQPDEKPKPPEAKQVDQKSGASEGAKVEQKAKEADQSALEPEGPTITEAALFQDPYAALAKIVGDTGAGPAQQAQLGDKQGTRSASDRSGLSGGEAYRDPFAPVSPPPGPPPSPADNARGSERLRAAPVELPTTPPPPSEGPSPPTRVTRSASGDVSKAEQTTSSPAASLKAQIDQVAPKGSGAEPGPKLDVQTSDEGLLISLTDEADFAMFRTGSAQPERKVVLMMEKIAQILKDRPGKIIIRGYTDGRPYKSGTYDNWRLSAARADMAHYMLVRGGLDDKRIERIEGYADRRLKVPSNPNAPENRRIEILLREDKP